MPSKTGKVSKIVKQFEQEKKEKNPRTPKRNNYKDDNPDNYENATDLVAVIIIFGRQENIRKHFKQFYPTLNLDDEALFQKAYENILSFKINLNDILKNVEVIMEGNGEYTTYIQNLNEVPQKINRYSSGKENIRHDLSSTRRVIQEYQKNVTGIEKIEKQIIANFKEIESFIAQKDYAIHDSESDKISISSSVSKTTNSSDSTYPDTPLLSSQNTINSQDNKLESSLGYLTLFSRVASSVAQTFTKAFTSFRNLFRSSPAKNGYTRIEEEESKNVESLKKSLNKPLTKLKENYTGIIESYEKQVKDLKKDLDKIEEEDRKKTEAAQEENELQKKLRAEQKVANQVKQQELKEQTRELKRLLSGMKPRSFNEIKRDRFIVIRVKTNNNTTEHKIPIKGSTIEEIAKEIAQGGMEIAGSFVNGVCEVDKTSKGLAKGLAKVALSSNDNSTSVTDTAKGLAAFIIAPSGYELDITRTVTSMANCAKFLAEGAITMPAAAGKAGLMASKIVRSSVSAAAATKLSAPASVTVTVKGG